MAVPFPFFRFSGSWVWIPAVSSLSGIAPFAIRRRIKDGRRSKWILYTPSGTFGGAGRMNTLTRVNLPLLALGPSR